MTDQASTLRKMMKQDENREKSGAETDNSRVIAVASGKGGVGKTNLTVNLGLALKDMGESVLLLDGDIGMANIDILLGLTSTFTLKHVINGNCSVEDAVIKGPEGLDILTGISGEEVFMDLKMDEIKRLLDASSHLQKRYDIIMIDIGAGVHQDVLNFTMAADEALIVLTPEPTAIMDAYSLIKILSNHNFRADLGLIVNMAGSNNEADDVTARMEKVIKDYLDIKIKIKSNIPYDRKVVKAVKKQSPVFSLFPGSEIARSYKNTAAKLLDRKEEISPQSMNNFFSKIIGMFKKG